LRFTLGYRNLIFDFDGTLADTKSAVIQIYNNLAVEYHVKEIKFDADTDKPLQDILKDLNISQFKTLKIISSIKKELQAVLHSLKAFDGICDLLMDLKSQNRRLFIISSNDSLVIKNFLLNNHIDCFEHIHSDSTLFGKHHLIKKLMLSYKLDPSETVYIGDEIRDIISSQKAKIKTIAVSWGYQNRNVLAKYKPDKIVSKPSEISDII
jgi:phosphoglycolate phosphatase